MWVVRLGHHDVDLLVGVADLERLRLCLIDLGFVLKYTRDDERWIRHDAGDAGRSGVLLLRRREIRHLTTRPRRPQTNGKVERFHQTMAREWAYGLRSGSSLHRAAALPHWLD